MQSPKSPSSSPKKSTRRRANTITFVNNTDDLINEFMNPTPAAPTTTTRRGLSPAWQRGTDDAEQSSPLRSAGSSMLLENSEDENSSSSDVSESVIIPNEMSSLSGTLVYSKSPGKKKKTKKTSPKNSTLYDKKKSKPFLEDYEMPTTPAPLNNSSVEYRSSLMGFRAFEKFPSGKVLKSKNINRQEKSTVNKVNDGRPKSAVKQKKPVAIHEYSYEYTVHPLYTGGKSQKQPATVRREEPEGMAVQGISLGSNRPTAPSNTKGKPTSDGKHRRSVIDTYTTNLSLKTTQTAPAKKDEKFAGVEILGEDIVGPLGDLSEKNDNIIQLGRPPVFSSETYTKAMGDPLKAVKREDDHDSDEETMLPQPPKTALFDYLTKYKMGDNSFGNSVADNSIKLNDTLSGATKTVRFLDEDRRLPSFDVETPPEYNMTGGSAPPSFAPLGGGYVPPSLQRPLMLDAPLVQSVADNPLGLPKTETVGALIPLPSTDPLAPPPPPTGLPPPPAPLPPPPPPPPLSQMPLNSSPQPINTNDDSADKLESTLPPGAMPAVPTATFPSWGDTLSTMNVAEEKKEELLLTTEEKEERKLIRQIAKAKQAASKRKAGLYGWQETPANVFFSDKEDNWIVLTDKERHFIQTLQAKEASNQITEDARSALLDTLRNDLMDEENDVDYQCITENVLDPSLCAYLLRKRYRDMSNTLVTEENTQSGSTLQDDYMPPRSSKAPKTNRTRSTMASQAVILRDPVKLLTCEHLNDDIGSTTTTRISVGTDIRMSMDSMMATAIHPVAPPGVKFCELTYAAKVLLSSILYLRALGGFPTLLRVQPLTDLSPVIDKENCIELVFWNPEPEPQPEEMAAPQTTPVSIFGRPSGEAAKRPSMAENVLGAALSGVRRRTTTFTGLSANGEVKERRTSSFSPHQAAPEPPKAAVAASADNSRVASPTHRGSATGDRETVRAGMEHTLGPGVPRIQDKEKKKKLRRSSYTTYNTPGEEAVSPEASINPGKNVFQSVGEVSPWLNYGERSNSIYAPVTAANAVKVEPAAPCRPQGKVQD
ncbi:hypothetical protein ADEAN_000249100 [Angomonas deanei]|uniref:Uncharacterized protein n=1 Tax=Angomonas deanei TaxID=59799 RepID=A0A7G2C5G1_9TRYP|nr:hypothetical protein ADEAN_000249100 [Angomonas deanei]